MDKVDGTEVVKLARQLERLMARRRRQQKKLEDIDEAIRTTRKLLRDMTAPMASDQALGLLPGEKEA